MADDVSEERSEKTSVLSSLPFSQNDKDLIERQLNATCVKTSSLDSVVDLYDIEKTADVITKHGYKNVSKLKFNLPILNAHIKPLINFPF